MNTKVYHLVGGSDPKDPRQKSPVSIGGGNSNIFLNVHPDPWEMIQFDEPLFSNGWVQPPTSLVFRSIVEQCPPKPKLTSEGMSSAELDIHCVGSTPRKLIIH